MVTMMDGDVYVNTGEGFGFGSYEEMREEILHYMNDEAYHDRMAQKARTRADVMLDSGAAFMRVMDEFENRMT